MTKVLKIILFLCFFCVSACSLASEQELRELYSTGESLAKPSEISGFVELKKAYQAPQLKLYYLNGQKVDLSQYRNKLLVLEAWATWCRICLQEMPNLIQLQNEFKGSDIEFVGINIDTKTSAIKPFLDKIRMGNFITWSDPTQSLGEIMPLAVVPSTYVFDGKGNLIGLLRGYVPWHSPSVMDYLKQLASKYAKQ